MNPPAAPGSQPSIQPAGDSALLLRFRPEISEARFVQVMGALRALDAQRRPEFVDVMPGYASLLVIFDPLRMDHAQAQAAVQQALAATTVNVMDEPLLRPVEIPVLYDPQVAPDLLPLCEEKRMSPDQLVAAHTGPLYRCHVMGFRPGFAFLGGLPPELVAARLATPRVRVAAGSVGIAGQQTGIYPTQGPGGWRIIGRTPLAMLQLSRPDPFLIHPGQRVRFTRIDRSRFLQLGGQLDPD